MLGVAWHETRALPWGNHVFWKHERKHSSLSRQACGVLCSAPSQQAAQLDNQTWADWPIWLGHDCHCVAPALCTGPEERSSPNLWSFMVIHIWGLKRQDRSRMSPCALRKVWEDFLGERGGRDRPVLMESCSTQRVLYREMCNYCLLWWVWTITPGLGFATKRLAAHGRVWSLLPWGPPVWAIHCTCDPDLLSPHVAYNCCLSPKSPLWVFCRQSSSHTEPPWNVAAGPWGHC